MEPLDKSYGSAAPEVIDGLRNVPFSKLIGCVVGRIGGRGAVTPGGCACRPPNPARSHAIRRRASISPAAAPRADGPHMNFAGVYGMAAHPTEDYLLIADSHITGGIYKIYTKDTTTDECSPAKNNNKWQTCKSRYGCGDMRETVTALNDRSNTCYKYDTKHVTVYPNRAHPTDPYNGKVDGIAIAPNGKYAVLSSSGGAIWELDSDTRSRDQRDVGLHRRRRRQRRS